MIHTASSCTYGPPRVQAVLPAHGRRISRARIAKFMQPFGIRGLADLPRRTRTTNSRHDSPIASNLLARNFTTTQPNQIWLADITYVATNKGWLYVAGVLDLDRRSLVDWFMNETLHAEGAFEAPRMAVDRQRSPPGPIHHSERGIQYGSEAYRRALATANITPSMSRKVDRQDNALLGSFFHTLKTERDHHRDYATRDEVRQDLFRYIEGFYNSGRLNSALGDLSPAGYKRRAA